MVWPLREWAGTRETHHLFKLNFTLAEAHDQERETPILGLCHGVFTDQFIFRHILGQFFPREWNLRHVFQRIRSVRYQKGKRNVIKDAAHYCYCAHFLRMPR